MSNGLPPLRYRGSHGNLRLWRECKTPKLFGVSGAVSLKQEAPVSIGGSTFTIVFWLGLSG